MSTLRMTLDAAQLTADTDARRVAGTIVPYGVPGRTSLGDVTIRAGALELPDVTNRIRLLYGHDRDAPIGAAITLEDTPEALHGTFAVARTPAGDAYLAELDPDVPIRDGLSVELDDVQLEGSEVTAGRLVAVAAVPLPAYTTARAALAAEERHDMTDEQTTTVAAEPAPAPLEASAAPTPALAAPLPPAPARTRPVSAVQELATMLAAAKLEGNTALRAALADITPTGNGAGNEQAGLLYQAVGELWSGVEYAMRYAPLLAQETLTGTIIEGFYWDTPPVVADYAGDKAAVPSNAAKLAYTSSAPKRLAGAHDIDRIYKDLGSPAVMASYWREMARSLAVQLDAYALDTITGSATAGTGTPANATAAIVKGTLEVSKYGTPSWALVSGDQIEAMSLETTANAPVGPPAGMSLPPIVPAPDLPAKTVIVGIRQAAALHTFRPPIRVEAVNIPNGGIDAGLFSYVGSLTHMAEAIVSYTVA